MSADPEVQDDVELSGKPHKHKKRKHKHEEDGERVHKRKRKTHDHDDADDSQPRKEKKKHKHKLKHEHDEAALASVTDSHTAEITASSVHPALSQSVEKSPFSIRTTAFWLPLSPVFQATSSQNDPTVDHAVDSIGDENENAEPSHLEIEGLCAEHLSPLISTYVHTLKGVLLAYQNVRLLENPADAALGFEYGSVFARTIDEYSSSYIWVAADFVLLTLQRGAEVDGEVMIQQENFISLVCWNMYTASIERKYLPNKWRWEPAQTHRGNKQQRYSSSFAEGDGQWIDADGAPVAGLLRFRVRDVELGSVNPSRKRLVALNIEGTMLTLEEERALEQRPRSGRERS